MYRSSDRDDCAVCGHRILRIRIGPVLATKRSLPGSNRPAAEMYFDNFVGFQSGLIWTIRWQQMTGVSPCGGIVCRALLHAGASYY